MYGILMQDALKKHYIVLPEAFNRVFGWTTGVCGRTCRTLY